MSTAQLYCQGACASCAVLSRSLAQRGVPVEVHDVTSDPAALAAVTARGYRSLPVLVGTDGAAVAGTEAVALASRFAAPLDAVAGAEGHVHHVNLKEHTS